MILKESGPNTEFLFGMPFFRQPLPLAEATCWTLFQSPKEEKLSAIPNSLAKGGSR
jgi:hypothetical protein